ncbi:MAG TPA: lipopolysaccharide kinase InaA family protein [Syntrophorhabdaceae bacterium]|nr:lipopolysaccharide kinase InaA family protein [Syntrophorhabdaceae bacterium]
MRAYIAPPFRDLLSRAGFDTFSRFWELPHNWVEDPNRRREGWSGASFHSISDTITDEKIAVFVKRQENHNYKSLLHPFRGMPTFYREFRSIRYMKRIGVPTAELIFYGLRIHKGDLQSVLVTTALTGYTDLDTLFEDRSLNAPLRTAILRRIADIVWLMHDSSRQHRHLNGKHILVKLGDPDSFDIRLIDLEQMKRILQPENAMARDLEKFVRHTPTLSSEEHAELVQHYLQHLKPDVRKDFAMLLNQRIVDKWPNADLTVKL